MIVRGSEGRNDGAERARQVLLFYCLVFPVASGKIKTVFRFAAGIAIVYPHGQAKVKTRSRGASGSKSAGSRPRADCQGRALRSLRHIGAALDRRAGQKISGDSIFSPGRGAGCGDLGKAGGDLSCSADSSGWRIRSAAARGQNQRDRGSTGQTRFLSPAVDVS